MIARLVLDASAAVRIILERPGADDLLEILSRSAFVIAPDLLTVEVANALWKHVSKGDFDSTTAVSALGRARALAEVLVPTEQLAEEALIAADTYGHPVYDMAYAVLARRHGASVLTLDRRLRAVLGHMGIQAHPAG